MSKKIIHVITGDLWAGAEAQVYYCLKELNRVQDDTLTAIVFNKGELYSRLSGLGVCTHVIDESNSSYFSQYRQLKNHLKSIKPDIVHVHDYKCHVLTSLAGYFGKIRFKTIRTVHGLTIIPVNLKLLKSYCVFCFEKILLNDHTDCIIAVSRDLERSFRRRYPHARICQINNAIEYPLSIKKSPESVRKEFSVSPGAFWIGTAARCVPVKNIEMLIEVARLLNNSADKIDFMISIFGDGQLKNHLFNLIRQNKLENRIFLLGHNPDILSIMKALDVFVLTSKHEGLPISLLEAMAVGTVPVCTRVGGMKEIIEDAKSGFLVELDNAREFAEKLTVLYHDPDLRRKMGKNAENRIKDDYSIEANIRKLTLVYNNAIERK
jgi:glycosyltransferase involved in cell wall biosynthesis